MIAAASLMFFLIKKTIGLRVTPEEEINGLDVEVWDPATDRRDVLHRYADDVLVIDGVEVTTADGHYAAFGAARAPYPLGGPSYAVIEDVGYIAVPDEVQVTVGPLETPPEDAPPGEVLRYPAALTRAAALAHLIPCLNIRMTR